MVINSTVGKFLYAFIFCIVVPWLLFLWADNVNLPIQIGDWRIAGIFISISGLALVVWGMINLWQYGKGLPMNGYPPTNFVRQGAYEIFNNPIYVGFCVLCVGVSCWIGSASGLFLISPIVILSCWALVVGYELPDLKKRFGEQYKSQGWFTLVKEGDERPTATEKWKAAIAIILPWFFLYEIFVYLDVSTYFLDTTFSFEKKWPVFERMEIPYLSIYFFVAAAPLLQKTKSGLRRLMLNAWVSTALGAFVMLALPFYATQRPAEGSGILVELIRWERTADSTAAAFPSFHVIWACVAAAAFTYAYGHLKHIWWTIAMLISLSCVGTGNHSIADVLAGLMVFLVASHHTSVWKWIQKKCELLANSWKSFQIGPLRVINHSLYAGLAGAAGIFLVAQLVDDARAILLVTSATLLGGAVWGQLTEGSSLMLRPFGYYGAIIGGVVGTLLCYFFLGTSVVILITSFALASPVIQGIGRLRCLVQGCCHGARTTNDIGIIYLNQHSRVCKISGMRGVPVHNTQLYSMIGNFISGIILWRLWYGGASASLLLGLYFIFNGIARFVEEAYRGEIQTKIFFKLRLYQWLAILFVIVGAIVTTLPLSTPLVFRWTFNFESIAVSLACGLMSAFAMGMDFPNSKVPFSRLTG